MSSPEASGLRPGLKLPPKRDVRFPSLDGKRVKCPYCGASFIWPPEELRCPRCARTMRPPPGHAPADMRQRRAAKEKIAEERDRELRKMSSSALSATAARPGGGGPHARAAALGAAMFMLMLGLLLSAASGRHSRGGGRRALDRGTWTAESLDTLAMALEHYRADCGVYPSGAEGLSALSTDPGQEGWAGPYASGIGNDGWNRPWFYDLRPDAPSPVLSSAGPDGKWRTEDDLSASPEQFRIHPDFVPHDPSRARGTHRSSVRIAQ